MTHPRRERTGGIAAALTLACHLAVLAWWLAGLLEPYPPRADDRPLQVIWVDPAPPPLPAIAPPPAFRAEQAPSVRSAPATAPAQRPSLSAVEIAPVAATDDTPAAAPLHAQARAWARAQTAPVDFVPDPLRHRAPPRPDGTFAMREPISAQDVVEGIGALVFGGGPTDPCPQIRRNLANADLGAGRALAEEELHRLQRDCL
ncbi:hypothetical protein MNO14_13790 [Luteimonas sp. S4-F44]|uniref:hypothetical protein n=1 Tax=Luteimonas sp. S4-F44 TaxID=2925842 RepID=UPI001F53489E|nr:hypothetical protein [Luteimonas sp. S4-F44]UNK42008.1 hypothetical protein MNO14_13790 [Luteimonas sp. S4-F44]